MKHLSREEGQGLVEYALILVLVAIVVIAILLLLGPVTGNVFSNITAALLNPGGGGGSQDSGAITGISIDKHTGSIQLSVTVSQPTQVTVSTTSGTISTPTKSCSGTCKFVVENPSTPGTATATGGGSTKQVSW